MAAAKRDPEVIDLGESSSDDEDDGIPLLMPYHGAVKIESDDEDEADDATLPTAGILPADDPDEEAPPAQAVNVQERRVDGGVIFVIDGDEVFIPEEKPQPAASAKSAAAATSNTTREGSTNDREFTVDDCLHHVLEIFPDVCHDHVHSLWASFDHESDYEVLAGRARLDNIVEQLVSSTTYPKQVKGKLKRKRDDSVDGAVDTKQWERPDRAAVPGWAKGSIAAICKADFTSIPRNHISKRLATYGFLFQTYVALAKDLDDTDEGARIFGRGRASNTTIAAADMIALNCGHVELVAELAAARLQVVALRSQREAAKAKKWAEEENLQKAIASGETAECSACFDDLPMNRQIHCDGETAHFTCFDCAETYIKSEVGDSRCKVLCPAGCGSGFSHSQLHLLKNKQLLEKLAQIQQEQDIRDAGLEDLESCPFCDYKAIMPPVEEDFEFRCANPECEKVSCRRCKAISHVPNTCEQHAKDNKLSSRHQIEEAMTAALVRSCVSVKCKKQFIKESGCNKMRCMSCGTLQCYVCSAVVKDYNHFDQGAQRGMALDGAQRKKCPLYDSVEERHEREVKEAETKARAEVVESNPDVSPEDLEIKVSEAVKKAESDRIKRAGGGFGGNYHAGLNAELREQLNRGARRLFGDREELDEGALGGMFRVFAARRPPGMAGDDVAANRLADAEHRYQQLREQQRQQQEQHLALMRALRARPQAHRDDVEGGEDGAAAPEPIYRGARAHVAEPLQGYIPIVFPHGQRRPQAQPAQQGPQPPAVQHEGFGAWPDFFGGLSDGNDPHAAQPPNAPARNGAPAAHDLFVPPPHRAADPNNNSRRQQDPNDHFFNNPYMAGAFLEPARTFEPLAQNVNPDFEVLRRQQQIVDLRRRAAQRAEQNEREAQMALLEQQRQWRLELLHRKRHQPPY